jgi:ribonuclease HI
MIGCVCTKEVSSSDRLSRLVYAGAAALNDPSFGKWCERTRSLGEGTNNIGELNGIALAFTVLEDEANKVEVEKQEAQHKADVEDATPASEKIPVAILTDSTYAVGILSKNWSAQKNQDLIASLRNRLIALRAFYDIDLIWVKAHVGLPGNERADQLANAACQANSTTNPPSLSL